MRQLLKILRGMVGVGIAFSAAVSAFFTVIVLLRSLLFGADFGFLMLETVVTGAMPIGFVLGFLFSGVVSVVGRGRSFDELSVKQFALLGAGIGLAFFMAFKFGTRSSWVDDVFNGALYALLGGGTAVGTLLVARKAESVLESGDEPGGESPLLPE